VRAAEAACILLLRGIRWAEPTQQAARSESSGSPLDLPDIGSHLAIAAPLILSQITLTVYHVTVHTGTVLVRDAMKRP
jgi:hypothetical protein